MPTSWIPMVLFALAGAISPGPVNVIASSLGARQGFWRALPHVAGASIGYCAVILLMGSGMNILLQTWPALVAATYYAGAMYLLYLAARIALTPATTPDAHDVAPDRHWRHNALQGLLAQTLNPKAWLVALSGVGLFVPPNPNHSTRLWLFCAISGVVCFLSVACWAALGTLIRGWLQQPRHQRSFNRALAALLVLTVAQMLDGF